MQAMIPEQIAVLRNAYYSALDDIAGLKRKVEVLEASGRTFGQAKECREQVP